MVRSLTKIAGLAILGTALAVGPEASAASRHHHLVRVSDAGVQFNHAPQHGGSALVSDGPGTGFGFHRLPFPYRIGAWRARDRQVDAVHDAIADDALSSGDLRHGYPGSSVYQYGSSASYGVFTGGDSYGSPYFAGYYGPGDGADYGPFGHAYMN